MDKVIELLKKIFGGDAEKMKLLDEFKIDKQDVNELDGIMKSLAEMQKNMKADPPSPASDDKSVKALISSLSEQVKTMQGIIAEQAKRQEERERAIEEEAKKAHAKKINEAISSAVKSGKIPAKNETEIAKWKGLFEKDYESAEFALSKIKEAKSDAPGGQPGGNDGKPNNLQTGLGSSLKPEFAKYVETVPITTE